MSDTFIYALAFLCGFIVAVLAVGIFRGIYKKKKGTKCEYDERQILARNSAYKGAFFTLAAYCILCMFMNLLELEWAVVSVQMIIGVLLSALIFNIICIFKDAYFVQKGWTMTSFLVFSLLMCAVQVFSFVMNITEDNNPIFTNGVLNENIVNLICGIIFFGTAVATIIKIIINKRVCEEE